MCNSIDLTGQTFERLKVIEKYGTDKRGSTLWTCKCSCGQTTTATTYQLRSGAKRSCSCLVKDTLSRIRKKHGECGSRLYKLWKGVRGRCYNPRYAQYKDYGGRGIVMCSEWKDDYTAFRDFMLSIGYDESLPTGEQTIERIDVNGNYEPSNCILVSQVQQNYNKRNNHFVTYKGVTKTITEFASEYGLDTETILNRINNFGYSIEEAIEKPVRKCPHKNAPLYEVDGEKKTMRDWAESFGLTRSQLKSKTRHKSVEQVIKDLKISQKGN